jgi:plastocyanin
MSAELVPDSRCGGVIMKRVLALTLLLAAVLTGAGTGATEVYRAAIDSDGVQRVTIQGGSYFYKPDHIIVKVNVPVELTLKKEPGITPHNLVIHAPEAGMDFNESMKDEPRTVRFTPTRTGKYPMFCDKKLLFFASHRDKGMEGVLEVVE